jgi:hypothetical protein
MIHQHWSPAISQVYIDIYIILTMCRLERKVDVTRIQITSQVMNIEAALLTNPKL